MRISAQKTYALFICSSPAKTAKLLLTVYYIRGGFTAHSKNVIDHIHTETTEESKCPPTTELTHWPGQPRRRRCFLLFPLIGACWRVQASIYASWHMLLLLVQGVWPHIISMTPNRGLMSHSNRNHLSGCLDSNLLYMWAGVSGTKSVTWIIYECTDSQYYHEGCIMISWASFVNVLNDYVCI